MATDPIAPEPRRKRKSPAGVATTDLVLSAYQGSNAVVFPKVLELHVPVGGVVADTTYGKGVFWRQVPAGRYTLWKSDLMDGVDARSLPYGDATCHAVVFDPPYMHAMGGTSHAEGGTGRFEDYYRNNARGATVAADVHRGLLDLYEAAAREAMRVLRPRGVFIAKCQDEVRAGRQHFVHVELINALLAQGYDPLDLFVVVRTNRPGVSRMLKQLHARKAHSYFVVVRKPRRPRPAALAQVE